eukprot:TRINITY_DN2491_c0_g1_i6.p1 TRINITY_DN2491_c0_g1~~TRINITY_DN2491_c0_g1_i6.p1  ORF type:complete len:566 (+),score=208.58 TRINITY_DN2491_c0_g1_i6:169-1866(+)
MAMRGLVVAICLAVAVAAVKEDGGVSLDSPGPPSYPSDHLARGRELLQAVRNSASQPRLASLGESLSAAQENLPQIKQYANKLMDDFMSAPVKRDGDRKPSDQKFDALVASIAQQLQDDKSKGAALATLSSLVKQAVHAEVLKNGPKTSGDPGAVDSADAVTEAPGQLEKAAEARVMQKISGEKLRRSDLEVAARTLEIQKARAREAKAQDKLNGLREEEAAARKKVVQLTVDEEKLRKEAAAAHSAATSPALARRMAREQSDTAMRLAREVQRQDQAIKQVKTEAKEALATTLQKDEAATAVRKQMAAIKDELEVDSQAHHAIKLAAGNALDKLHSDLAKRFSRLQAATATREQAEAELEAAEQQQAVATEPDERVTARTRVEAARSAVSQAMDQQKLEKEAQVSETTVAGGEKMKQVMKVTTSKGKMEESQAQVKRMRVELDKVETEAAEAQQEASNLAIQSSAATAKLKELQAQAQAAAQAALEAKRMTSGTVAKEVSTKKAIAVASTNFVKRQAAAKVLELEKRKKAAEEELSVIRVVADRLSGQVEDDTAAQQDLSLIHI